MKKIIFIGGIHGAGKGTFCAKLSNALGLTHFSSSELINWTKISSKENKTVSNIQDTQNRLIESLNSLLENHKTYILDGHFSLLNSEHKPVTVPFETFKLINPCAIVLVIENVEVIYNRLNIRDKVSYNLDLLKKFQSFENQRAHEIANKLEIDLKIYKNNYEEALEFIKNKL